MAELDRIDFPALATALGQRMRAAGVPATPGAGGALCAGAGARRPGQANGAVLDGTISVRLLADPAADVRSRLRCGLRSCPGAGRGAWRPVLPAAELRSAERAPAESRGPAGARGKPRCRGGRHAGHAGDARDDREAREVEVPLALASEEERLRKKSFEALDPDELEQILRLMAAIELAAPRRRSRRRRRARRGEHLDLRRTLRASLRTGGDPMTLASRTPAHAARGAWCCSATSRARWSRTPAPICIS